MPAFVANLVHRLDNFHPMALIWRNQFRDSANGDAHRTPLPLVYFCKAL
ncbi:hypothetical protein L798_09528 [Zootermopsis nevadensis]|uniref:Uncharacterized protein n=1 Tax=Zootermopsis nevadensis TaxID=136037 RepID=A0A067RJA0_ZOONE|nr:hypothetical protein L798_09528 [Zootermopsis nevadensis]